MFLLCNFIHLDPVVLWKKQIKIIWITNREIRGLLSENRERSLLASLSWLFAARPCSTTLSNQNLRDRRRGLSCHCSISSQSRWSTGRERSQPDGFGSKAPGVLTEQEFHSTRWFFWQFWRWPRQPGENVIITLRCPSYFMCESGEYN